MSRIVWDKAGERYYEAGVSKTVLYPTKDDGKYDKGVGWNGMTNITDSPDGAEPTALWADNIKYLNLMSAEECKLGIEAYTYPDEFAECDGSAEIAPGVTIGQQKRKPFGLCYRTEKGSDTNSEAGYKLHLVYGCLASPSEKSYETINDSPDAITFSWDITTTPVEVTGFKPTATMIIDSAKVDAAKLKALEDKLYGTESEEPTLLLPDEVVALVGAQG